MIAPVATLNLRTHCRCGRSWPLGARHCNECNADRPPDYGTCPRCSQPLTAPNQGRHPECGGAAPATLSAIEPSVRVGHPTRERATALAAARAAFDRDVVALTAALVQVEQTLRDAKLGAQQIGALEQLQSGRATESTRDSLLAATRHAVSQAARRLESAAWSQQ